MARNGFKYDKLRWDREDLIADIQGQYEKVGALWGGRRDGRIEKSMEGGV